VLLDFLLKDYDEVPVLNRLVGSIGFMLLTLPIFFADVGVK